MVIVFELIPFCGNKKIPKTSVELSDFLTRLISKKNPFCYLLFLWITLSVGLRHDSPSHVFAGPSDEKSLSKSEGPEKVLVTNSRPTLSIGRARKPTKSATRIDNELEDLSF